MSVSGADRSVSGRGATRALGVLVAVAFAGTLMSIGSPAEAATGLFVQALFVAPGLFIVARTLARGTGWLPVVAFGPIVGLGVSSLALLTLWVAGGRGAWLLVAAPALASVLAWPAARLRDRWRLTQPHAADARMLLLALLIVPVLVWRPFAHVGAQRPEGQVYRKYFTADYVWRRAVVAELAKGDVLPANPYYIDDPLHYYWLPHLLSAVEYRAWPETSLDTLLLTRSVLVDAMFTTALYGAARLAVPQPWAALAGVACGFLATSFEALAAWWVLWRDQAPLRLVRYLNIDAISRWDFGGMPIDGLQRILWYQPHHAAGYILGMLGVLAVARRRRSRDPAVFAVAGTLLAMSTIISSFAGLMYATIAAVYEAVQTLYRRQWANAVFNAAYAALPLAIGAAVVTALHYVDQPPDASVSVIRFGLNPLSTVRVWTVTAMSFGPALILGAVGAWAGWRQRNVDLWPFLVVLPVSAWFYFYVDIRDHQDVYVGWRVGHLVFMALIPLMGLAFVGVRNLHGAARWCGGAALALTIGLALPTVAIDAFNTQDIEPNGLGPGWQRVEVITPAEQEGLQWIKTHTDLRAVVQVDTAARDSEMWAYIPAFAERRMAVGVPLSMVPLKKYIDGARALRWMYDTDPVSAHAMANQAGIDFLVIGAPERKAHRGVEERWATTPDLLPRVFHNSALSVYEVRHHRL